MNKTMTREKASLFKAAALKMLVGAAIGGSVSAAAIALAGTGLLDAMGPSRVALAGVALVYLLMGGLVAFGLVAPQAGAKLLNVGDADELRDERAGMARSVAVMWATGVLLLLLALARGPGFVAGPVSAEVAMGALLLSTAAGVFASWRWRNAFDELNWQLGLEGCLWAFCLSWVVLSLWAAADFLGFGAALTPIDVVTTLAAMMLLGSFAAIGKRGMMTR